MDECITRNLIPRLPSRAAYFDYLDRWTVGTIDDLRAHMTSRALVKAFLLETSRNSHDVSATEAFARLGERIEEIDHNLYRVGRPNEPQDWALLETTESRFPVIYTAMERSDADRRVKNVVDKSPWLDRAWLTSPMFHALWEHIGEANIPERFSKIVFEHESVYESNAAEGQLTGDDSEVALLEEEQDTDRTDDEADLLQPERRRARLQITERIGILRSALQGMRSHYDPLQSIVALRMPAPRRGGHDIYYDGRFTNRSDSVLSLRQTVQLVTALYQGTTMLAEDAARPRSTSYEEGTTRTLGTPVFVRFSKSLDTDTFERLIASLSHKRNRFRLWGRPIARGTGKIHVYAVDNHLWQPLDLEITRNHIYAMLHEDTCGNAIHRLIANIQRYVDPKIEAYIGDRSYESFVKQAMGESSSGNPRD
jgi:hypothetical protein